MKDELLSAKLSGEAWIADEEVTGWEDIYHSVAFELDNVPVAITFGQGGRVVAVEPVSKWLDLRKGAKKK
jgi:hypothetical protein